MAKMFIGGESVDSVTKNTSEVRNPATGATVDTVPQGNDKDVQQAIQAAEEAFKVWADVSPEDRGNALMNAGELIKKNTAEIAQLLTQEQGKTLFEAGLEIHHLVHGLEFYAGLASKVRGSHVPLPQKSAYGMVVRQPIGVCGGIVPWNFPLTLMGTKLGPALAAGNTIIIKPASTTPLATIKVIELIAQATFGEGKAQKTLPKGTVNIVTGPGGSVGEELLRNPRVRRIAFTGSTPIGRHVMEVAGREIKRVTLELGGSDPMIVMEDANRRSGRENGRRRPLFQLRPDVPGREAIVPARIHRRQFHRRPGGNPEEENRRQRHEQRDPHGPDPPRLAAPGSRRASRRRQSARRQSALRRRAAQGRRVRQRLSSICRR